MISFEESRLAENMYMHLCFHFWIVIPFRSRSFARSLARRLANHVTRQLSPHTHTGYLGPKSVCWLRTWSPGIAPGVLSVCVVVLYVKRHTVRRAFWFMTTTTTSCRICRADLVYSP